MHRVLALIENTFKESLRQRVLVLLAVFGILIIIVSIFIEPFALGEASRIIRDFGLGASAFFSFLLVVVVGSTLIHRDIEKRTIFTVITKPVRRSEIILGKFFGFLALIVILISVMAIIHQLIILAYEGSLDIRLLINVPFLILEIMILLGILLLFSSFSSSTLSAVMCVMFFIIGHASPDLKLFADHVKIPAVRHSARALYYVLPNLENFNFRIDLVHRLALPIDELFYSFSYGLIYTALLLCLAVIIFEKREFR